MERGGGEESKVGKGWIFRMFTGKLKNIFQKWFIIFIRHLETVLLLFQTMTNENRCGCKKVVIRCIFGVIL